MRKYLVAYEKKHRSIHVGPVPRTRFFTTDDLEAEWKAFESFSKEHVRLVSVTDLGEVKMCGS